MTTSLDRFIDLANYHPDAVAEAGKGAVADTESGLLIIRLGMELHRKNRPAAEQAIARLEDENRQGYELFQLLTAKIILALWAKDDSEIVTALDAWLEARRTMQGSWRHDALEAPELAPHLAQIDPVRLALPEVMKTKVTKADRALIKDLDAARKQAVAENLIWLREAGVSGTITSIAKAYRITYANHHLREVTLSAKEDWPDLVIALDKDGALLGSFIAH